MVSSVLSTGTLILVIANLAVAVTPPANPEPAFLMIYLNTGKSTKGRKATVFRIQNVIPKHFLSVLSGIA